MIKTGFAMVKKIIKPRKKDSHKGENGRVLVVGGSKDYCGAPAMVALAALRAGADLVYVAAPNNVARVIASYSPDLIVREYEGEWLNENGLKMVMGFEKNVDVLVIGNGLGNGPGVLKVVKRILKKWKKPVVIDADAIQKNLEITSGTVLLTPHEKEFVRMCGIDIGIGESLEKRAGSVLDAANRMNVTILLKGIVDVVSDGKKIVYNETGNEGMTKGGTGDVLAGICGSLMAQRYSPLEAGTCAVFMNGKVGDVLLRQKGYSFTAMDIVENLFIVMKLLVKRNK